MTKEASQPIWYEHVLDGESDITRQGIRQLREVLTCLPRPQLWLYPGSRFDITPILVAPPDTTHLYVDLIYDGAKPDSPHIKETLFETFTAQFMNAGASVTQETSWELALQRKRQTVTIDDQTVVQLIGSNFNDRAQIPNDVDVIYNNQMMGLQIPELFQHLRVGGIYLFQSMPAFYDALHNGPDSYEELWKLDWDVCFDDMVRDNGMPGNLAGKTIFDFGFIEKAVVRIENDPSARVDIGHSGNWLFRVFEKTREFTEEESENLKRIKEAQVKSWQPMK